MSKYRVPDYFVDEMRQLAHENGEIPSPREIAIQYLDRNLEDGDDFDTEVDKLAKELAS